MMLTSLSTPDLTWLFLAVVVGLLSAAVWAFWEIEQASKRVLLKTEKARSHHRAPS